jgi:hypothetical protein
MRRSSFAGDDRCGADVLVAARALVSGLPIEDEERPIALAIVLERCHESLAQRAPAPMNASASKTATTSTKARRWPVCGGAAGGTRSVNRCRFRPEGRA